MEFKGITWVGNVYQKFEEMCLEVEEAMYEDTVKYVENQVQKVGFSVKKFCSAVTEDLLPPSGVYPVNLASGDLSLNSYGDIDVIKKPIPRIFDSHDDLKKKENKDQVISNPAAEKESSLNGCYDINSLLVHSKSRAPIRKKVGQKNPIGIKRISRNSHPSKDYCRTNSESGDRIELASRVMRSSSSVASDDQILKSTSYLDVRTESEEAAENTPIPDTPIESSSAAKVLSAESLRVKEDDQDFKSPDSGKPSSAEFAKQNIDVRTESEEAAENTPIPDTPIESSSAAKILSAESLRVKEDDQDFISPASGKPSSAEFAKQNIYNSASVTLAFDNNLLGEPERLKGDSGSTSSSSGLHSESTGIRRQTCNNEIEGEVVMVCDEGTSMKYDSSIISTNLCFADTCDEEIIKSDEDGFDMEIIEEDEFGEPRFENFQREKLDESCVMVEGDELRSLPQGTRKHMSYKKKIRAALTLKLRSGKDNRHKDLGRKNKDEVVKDKEAGSDSLESDWEVVHKY